MSKVYKIIEGRILTDRKLRTKLELVLVALSVHNRTRLRLTTSVLYENTLAAIPYSLYTYKLTWTSDSLGQGSVGPFAVRANIAEIQVH